MPLQQFCTAQQHLLLQQSNSKGGLLQSSNGAKDSACTQVQQHTLCSVQVVHMLLTVMDLVQTNAHVNCCCSSSDYGMM